MTIGHNDECPLVAPQTISDLKEKLSLHEAVLDQLKVARAGWIHHCNAPEILQALWKLEGEDPHKCIFTSPGIGAAGHSYCIHCGQPKGEERG